MVPVVPTILYKLAGQSTNHHGIPVDFDGERGKQGGVGGSQQFVLFLHVVIPSHFVEYIALGEDMK